MAKEQFDRSRPKSNRGTLNTIQPSRLADVTSVGLRSIDVTADKLDIIKLG